MCVFVSSFSLYNELGSSWRREFVWKTIFIDFLSFFFHHQRKKNFFGDSNIWAFFLLYPALQSFALSSCLHMKSQFIHGKANLLRRRKLNFWRFIKQGLRFLFTVFAFFNLNIFPYFNVVLYHQSVNIIISQNAAFWHFKRKNYLPT